MIKTKTRSSAQVYQQAAFKFAYPNSPYLHYRLGRQPSRSRRGENNQNLAKALKRFTSASPTMNLVSSLWDDVFGTVTVTVYESLLIFLVALAVPMCVLCT